MSRPLSEEAIEARASDLHARAVVIDCHSDLLMPIADGYTRFAEDPPVPDPAGWQPPFALPPGSAKAAEWPFGGAASCIGQYSLPKLRAGGLTAQVCAIFVEDERLDHALKRSLEMVYWFHREMEENSAQVEMATTAADIRRLKKEGKCAAVLALEGFEPLSLDLRLLDVFYRLGVRMGGMAHNRRNAWCDGTLYNTSDAGLTPLGKQAVRRMNELRMVVDVGHLTAKGFWETLEASTAPVVLSHRSPRKFFPLKVEESPFYPVYDLSRGKERLEALAKNGGVFGVFFLAARDPDDVVADIDYVADLVGPDHVGLGSDLYGRAKAPKGLEDMSKVPAITRSLVRRGHSDENILKFLGENFMRVFREVWKE
jgi:membrane dipeptidase